MREKGKGRPGSEGPGVSVSGAGEREATDRSFETKDHREDSRECELDDNRSMREEQHAARR